MQRIICIISYIVVLAVFCASAAFAVGWEPAIPTPSNLPYLGLRAIAAKSDSNIVAVGAEGAVAYYDGTGWAEVLSGASGDLHKIIPSHSGKYYAAGYNATIVHGDGLEWEKFATPLSSEFVHTDIAEKNTGELFVTGYKRESSAVSKEGLFATHNGTDWTTLLSGVDDIIYNLCISDSGVVYCSSLNGKVYEYSGGVVTEIPAGKGEIIRIWVDAADSLHILTETDVWKRVSGAWERVVAIPVARYWTAGKNYSGFPILSWDGVDHEFNGTDFVTLTPPDNASIYEYYYLNKNDFVALCPGNGLGRYFSDEWAVDNTHITDYFVDILPVGEKEAYLLSNSRGILHYKNDTLEVVHTPSATLKAINMDSSGNIYAVGNGGIVVQKTDSGWVELAGTPSLNLSDLWCSPTGKMYTSGNGKFYTYDNGVWSSADVLLGGYTEIVGSTDDDIYGVAYNGLYHYSGGVWAAVPGFGDMVIHDLDMSESGELYVAGYEHRPYRPLLVKYKDGVKTEYSLDREIAFRTVSASSSGVYVGWDGGIGKVVDTYISPQSVKSLNLILKIDVGPDGTRYAVGSTGIFLIDDGKSIAEALIPSEQPALAQVVVTKFAENERSWSFLQTHYAAPNGYSPKTSVREFVATTSVNNGNAVFKFRTSGLSDSVGNLQLFKLLDTGNCTKYSPYDSAGGVGSPEGTWWIKDSNGIALEADEILNESELYDVYFVLKDNGIYDLDPAAGSIRDPLVLGGPASGRGGGCSLQTQGSSDWALGLFFLCSMFALLTRRLLNR
ncbi:MAG: hypothetical protein ACNI27_15155 [Desulfovibrio sp.]